MTRATLLHVLDQPTALGAAEVRELEQLATAFPYCQTAHLLLAKAAHDHGTMLAGQRLRRAATYAADRALLRRLIEEVAPATVAPAPANVAVPEAEAPREPTVFVAVAPTETSGVAPDALDLSTQLVDLPVPEPLPATRLPAAGPLPDLPESSVEAAPQSPEPLPIELPKAEALFETTESAAAHRQPLASAAESPAVAAATLTPASLASSPLPITETVTSDAEVSTQLIVTESNTEQPVTFVEPSITTSIFGAGSSEAVAPVQAPAVRPPAEAGEARFEFGLAETPAVPLPAYELPGLVDEWAASAVTRGMGSPEPLAAVPGPPTLPTTELTPAAFTGDAAIGYALGENSRLGFAMQLLDTLVPDSETKATDALPPAAAIPPTGAFFEPDPLLLAHWAAHCPPAPVLPSSLDLINNFLRRQPRLTRPAMLPPTPASQADLSVRSTRTEPDLASESLARIFVRQGKTARAIEIYEKLMVKHPEKMAYFASQIHSLQPLA